MSKLAIQLQQYLFVLLGVFIPTSIAITNCIIVAISFCWLLEGNFKVKFESIKNSNWILSIFALIFLYALGMFWGDVHLDAHWQFQKLALLLVFPVLFTIQLNQSTIRHGVTAFLITTFISACIAILINNNLLSPLSEYIALITPDSHTSAFIKYNYHNVLLALAFGVCLYLIIENKTKYKRLLGLFIIVYAVSIFTEIGRAGQVLFNLISLFYIIYYSPKQIFKSGMFFILLLGFQFLVYQTTNAYKQRIQAVSHILQNNGEKPNNSKDIRYVFVEESLNKIFEKPFLGHGTGSFGATLRKQVKGHNFSHHKTPHNQYLYVWFELGVFGLFLLGMIFYYQILELLKKKDRVHMALLPLSFMFLMLIDSYLFIFILTIAYIYLYTICSRYKSE